MSRKLIAPLLVAALTLTTVPVATITMTTPAAAASTHTEADIAAILANTNKARTDAGLPALTIDTQLNSIAADSAATQAANNATGGNPDAASKVPGWTSFGQIYASGFSPSTITAQWLNSTNAKAQLLSTSHTKTGIGVVYSSTGKPYYTQLFAGFSSTSDSAVSVEGVKSLTSTPVSDTQINLSWGEPAYTGVLKAYTITVTGTNYSKTFTTTAKSFNVTGLTENTQYKITVQANAASKDGKYTRYATISTVKTTLFSAASTVAVSAPTNVKRTALSTSAFTLTWAKPATLQGTLVNYTVKVTGGTVNKTFTTTDLTKTVTALPQNTKYSVVITANAKSANGLYTKSAATVTTVTTVRTITQADIDRIIADTNAFRKAAGLAPLKQNTAMNTVASNWTKVMASENTRYHNPNSNKQIPAGWSATGENVANGFTVETVTQAWYDSPGHRANLLNPRFTDIGVGIAYNSNGQLFYTQNFAEYK